MHLRSTRGAYTPRRFSGLHWESFFEIVELVIAFMGAKGCGVKQDDCARRAPLLREASNEHNGVVKLRLGWRDIYPDRPDAGGNMPLLRGVCWKLPSLAAHH